MKIINLFCFLFFFGHVFYLNAQSKINNINKKQLPLKKELQLPTPDRLAFIDSLFKLGASQRGHRYFGYTRAILNGKSWQAYPSGFSPNSMTFGFQSKLFKPDIGSIIGKLHISFYEPINKKYYILKNESAYKYDCTYYITGEDGCTLEESYKLTNSNRSNFIKVVDFNEKTGILKARFRIALKRESNNANYPEILFFDDGIIYTKVLD